VGLQVTLSASLVASPSAQTDNLFPSAAVNVNFNLNPPAKPYTVEAGGVINIVSPSPAFANVGGVGAAGQVTQAHTLYARSSAGMILQITTQNPNGGGNIVVTIPIMGVFLAEFPSNGLLVALAVQGTGTFEYQAFGNQ
jgi:hypothetical protein